MGKIKQLSNEIIAKIAAGEVIERPAYAVKELVDNAIDAGADSITVFIEDSGLKSITVIDNGEGMTKEDLLVSFQPHTTSKLQTVEQLHRISSLGFRGEALWSIASVSKLSLKSRPRESVSGYSIELDQGNLINQSVVGMPPGTQISVRNIFFSVPARKKFLKSTVTELRHIVEIVTNFALAFPQIQLVVKHGKQTLIDLPRNQTIAERLVQLFGEKMFSQLLSISFKDPYVQLEGFIGSPQLATPSIKKQYLFINQRRVNDRSISQSLKEAYGNLIAQNAQPVFFLYLSLPFETVDVNIHPRKEQVSLTQALVVNDSIKKTVQEVLQQQKVIVRDIDWLYEKASKKGETHSFAGLLLKESVTPWQVKEVGKVEENDISQLHNLYLVVQTKTGLMLIDQHAAHERILYEQFKSAFEKQKKLGESYDLQAATLLHLSPTEFQILEQHSAIFVKLGFLYEEFAGNSIKIIAVPKLFKDRDIEVLLRELLADLEEGKIKDVDRQTDLMLSYLACRAAIKAGDTLTKKEMKKLHDQLEITDNNLSCPHGRPTKIEIKLSQLNTIFKRS